MMQVLCLTFNPFEENTYLLYDASRECIIVDPGCSTPSEERALDKAIEERNLTPVRLINTHAHIDHVLGVDHVHNKYGLELELHDGERTTLALLPQISAMYGMPLAPVEAPVKSIAEGDTVEFGSSKLKVLYTPGHSPASICLYNESDRIVIAGDVLFNRSIGRTDLPGGDYDTLIASITDELLPLGDDVVVYPGHGPETTIGDERRYNPFIAGLR